jgi:hypothetical protein
VRRLERAQLAAEHQKIRKQSVRQNGTNDDIDQDLEGRFQISKSQKDVVNIRAYVYENEGDPAFEVGLCIMYIYSGN